MEHSFLIDAFTLETPLNAVKALHLIVLQFFHVDGKARNGYCDAIYSLNSLCVCVCVDC